ncbi:Hypothetical protein mma_0918 [Janthinobacterium sp. Marseille]|nr:Hypothetical protein mma_0918 [Janthinobacterium sp. Marseille]
MDSCRHCAACNADLEQYCAKGATWTYNGTEHDSDKLTFDDYSDHVVVEERFVVKVPGTLDVKAVAPLLCAGIPTYSPLRQDWPGTKGWHHRPRWPGLYGRQICQGDGRACGDDYYLAG